MAGGGAETRLEALKPLGAKGDLGQKDQHLSAPFQGFGDGLEIDFRLAGPGDAFEKRHLKTAVFHRLLKPGCRFLLIRR